MNAWGIFYLGNCQLWAVAHVFDALLLATATLTQ